MSAVNIKIPSPSIVSLRKSLSEKGVEVSDSDITDEYMMLVSETLKYVGGSHLSYKNAELDSKHTITADINIKSLPHYEDIVTAYLDLNFDGAMASRIKQMNEKLGDACPPADATSLRQPLEYWHPRWITVYVWCLMCLAGTDSANWSDAAVSEAVELEWISNLSA